MLDLLRDYWWLWLALAVYEIIRAVRRWRRAGPRAWLEFDLDGHRYRFVPPSGDDLADVVETAKARPSQWHAGFKWLRAGLLPEDFDRLTGRLDDPDDDLDLHEVADVVEWTAEETLRRNRRAAR
jgi:hypothetical protein